MRADGCERQRGSLHFKYVYSFISSLLSSVLNLTVSVSQTFRSYEILKICAFFLSEMKMIENNLHFCDSDVTPADSSA